MVPQECWVNQHQVVRRAGVVGAWMRDTISSKAVGRKSELGFYPFDTVCAHGISVSLEKPKTPWTRLVFVIYSRTKALLFHLFLRYFSTLSTLRRPTKMTSTPDEPSLLLSQPVVMDNGTAHIRAGFAGSSQPKVSVASKVGRTKHQRVMPGGALEDPSQYFCGEKLDEHRGAFYLESPMEHGAVQGWDAMERLWEVRT